MIDHVNFMLDGIVLLNYDLWIGKVYEEGLKVVLPLMLVSGGVQESITRLERDKIRVALKVKESIGQIKTVLDGLFYVGGMKQADQLQIKGIGGSQKSLDRYEDELFKISKSR